MGRAEEGRPRAQNAQFAEERDALRERMRLVLAQYTKDLTDRLQLEQEEAAIQMYFEFPSITVIGGVFGLHHNKLAYSSLRRSETDLRG